MFFLILILLSLVVFAFITKPQWMGGSLDSLISSITAILTLALLYVQYKHSKSLTKLTTTPSYFFTLKSSKTYLGEERWQGESEEDKRKTYLFVRNYSNFPVLFGIKITFKVHNGSIESHIDDHYYKNPLSLGPGGFARYPDVIHLGRIIEKMEKNEEFDKIEITAHIETFCNPYHISKPRYGRRSENWTFNFKEYIWRDPQGTRDNLIVIR